MLTPYQYCPYFKKNRKRMYPTYKVALLHCFDGMHVFTCTSTRLPEHFHVGHPFRDSRVSRRVSEAEYEASLSSRLPGNLEIQ